MSDETFIPLLPTYNWSDEWKHLQIARKRTDNAAAWDARAKTYSVKHGSQHEYVQQFLKLANIQPGETILDMGCGTGALATPLAQKGHDVIACDFSQSMIDFMLANQAKLGIRCKHTYLMSWQDNWDEYGLGAESVDVALASRSVATSDLCESLMKLNRVARRRICLTISSGASSKADPSLLAAAGFENHIGCDFLYAFTILAQKGFMPEVAYISSIRIETFDSFTAALDSYTNLVCKAMTGIASTHELARVPNNLRPWLTDNLVHDSDGVHLAKPRSVTWAFIAWNKRN